MIEGEGGNFFGDLCLVSEGLFADLPRLAPGFGVPFDCRDARNGTMFLSKDSRIRRNRIVKGQRNRRIYDGRNGGLNGHRARTGFLMCCNMR